MNTKNNSYELNQANSSPSSDGSRQKYNTNRSEVQNFNRLFILYPKEASEDELNRAFEKFGKIQMISIIKDQNTQTEKGIYFDWKIVVNFTKEFN